LFSNRFLVSVSTFPGIFLQSGKTDTQTLGTGLHISEDRTDMESRKPSPVKKWAWAASLENSPHKRLSTLGNCFMNSPSFEGRTNYDLASANS